MTLRTEMLRVLEQEDINFLLTNRIPRRLLTRFMGWFSRIEQPLVRDLSIGAVALLLRSGSERGEEDAVSQHARLLHPGAQGRRPAGRSRSGHPGQPLRRDRRRMRRRSPATELFQVKGISLHAAGSAGRPAARREAYRNGCYVTLRLTSSMYHRFHAPHDCRVEQVTYISGDTWNVNPIALQARREAVLQERARGPCARAHRRRPRRDAGAGRGHPGGQHPAAFPRCAAALSRTAGRMSSPATPRFEKGQEMGWFEHGSTIIVLAPNGFSLCDNVRKGASSAWASR